MLSCLQFRPKIQRVFDSMNYELYCIVYTKLYTAPYTLYTHIQDPILDNLHYIIGYFRKCEADVQSDNI